MPLTEIAGLVTPNFTIECAFRIDNSVAGMVLAGKQTNTLEWGINLDDVDSNKLMFSIQDETSGLEEFTVCSSLSSYGITADSQWHYLSIVMDFDITGSLDCRIDNKPVSNTLLTTATGVWDVDQISKIVIGAEAIDGTKTWEGGVDEFQIYLHALSSAIRDRNYNWWRFDAAFGTAEFDVDVNVADITDTVPSGAYSTPLLIASITGGVGQFAFLWTSDGIALTPDSPTSAATTFSGDRSDYNTTETLTCTVTDTGNGDAQVFDVVTTDITWEAISNPADPNLIMHHTFDNMSGNTSLDETDNNHDITFANTPDLRTGHDGLGLYVYKDNTGNIPYHADFAVQQWSASIWVNPLKANNKEQFMGFRTTNGSGTRYGWYLSTGSSNLWNFYIDNGYEDRARIYTNETLNVWSHVVATFDGSYMRLYINGVLKGTKYRGAAVYNGACSLFIGGDAYNDVKHRGRGTLDEAKFFNKALTANEILTLYNGVPSFEVDIAPSHIVQLIDPAQQYTSSNIVATVNGGVGSFTYNWTRISGSTFSILNGQGTDTIQIQGLGFNDETTDVFECEVTDTGNGDAVTTETMTIIVNWDAV